MGRRKGQKSNEPVNRDSSESGRSRDTSQVPEKSSCIHINRAVDQPSVRKHFKTSQATNHHKCVDCNSEEVYVCLRCGQSVCLQTHGLKHEQTPRSDAHSMMLDTSIWSVWCFKCNSSIPLDASKKLRTTADYIRSQFEKATVMPDVAIPLGPPPPPALPDFELGKPTTTTKTSTTTQGKINTQQPKPVKIRGLTNLGNTCFFNSVLQCLAQTPNLVEYLNDLKPEVEEYTMPSIEEGEDEMVVKLSGWGPLTQELAHTLAEINKGTDSCYSPRPLLDQIRKKCPQFCGYDQHDAHELLRELLNAVRTEDLKRYQKVILTKMFKTTRINPDDLNAEEKAKAKQWNQKISDSISTKPINIFKGQTECVHECQDCRHRTAKIEPFMDLSLPVLSEKPQPPTCKKNRGDSFSEEPKLSKHQQKKQGKLKKKGMKVRKGGKGQNNQEDSSKPEDMTNNWEEPPELIINHPEEDSPVLQTAQNFMDIYDSFTSPKLTNNSPTQSCSENDSSMPTCRNRHPLPIVNNSDRVSSHPSHETNFTDDSDVDIQICPLLDDDFQPDDMYLEAAHVPSMDECGDSTSVGCNNYDSEQTLGQSEPEKWGDIPSDQTQEKVNPIQSSSSYSKLPVDNEISDFTHEERGAPPLAGCNLKYMAMTDQLLHMKGGPLPQHLERRLAVPSEHAEESLKDSGHFTREDFSSDLCSTRSSSLFHESGFGSQSIDEVSSTHPSEGMCSTESCNGGPSLFGDEFHHLEHKTSIPESDIGSMTEEMATNFVADSDGDALASPDSMDANRSSGSINTLSPFSDDSSQKRQIMRSCNSLSNSGEDLSCFNMYQLSASLNQEYINEKLNDRLCQQQQEEDEKENEKEEGEREDEEEVFNEMKDEEIGKEDVDEEEDEENEREEDGDDEEFNKENKTENEIKEESNNNAKEDEEDEHCLETSVGTRLTLAPRLPGVEGECSLMSCLNHYTSIELLAGNNKVTCDQCTRKHNRGTKKTESVKTAATLQTLIVNPPPVLICHLKRFQMTFSSLKKITKQVPFPLNLSIGQFCSHKCQGVKEDQTDVQYSLYGVVEHSGSLHGGHYVAYVKTASGQWYYASDYRVNPVNQDRVLKSEAYLLFYHRIC